MGIKSREGKGHHEIKRKIVDSSRIVVCIDPGEKCTVEEHFKKSEAEIIGRKDQKDSIDYGLHHPVWSFLFQQVLSKKDSTQRS